MKRTILITGGAGFVGSNFVRHLFQRYSNYHLIVLDALTYAGNLDNLDERIKTDPRFEFWHGDVRNSALVFDLVGRADTVVHFAAETHVARSIHDNRKFFETDVLGTQSVANAVLRNLERVERFLHISTSEVYGTAESIPMTEQHPLNPLTPYAAAKAGADRLVYSYIQTYQIPALILRPFNQYGPFQHLEKVVPRFITSALLQEPLTVHGDGQAQRDWMYVDDTCRRIEQALHAPIELVRGAVLNLGSGQSTDVITIARMILELTGQSESLISHMKDRPGQVHCHCSSTQAAEQLLHVSPPQPLEDGLEATVRWYRDNRSWWEKQLAMRKVAIRTKRNTILYY